MHPKCILWPMVNYTLFLVDDITSPHFPETVNKCKPSNNRAVKRPAALHGSMHDFCKPEHVAAESITERTGHVQTLHLAFRPHFTLVVLAGNVTHPPLTKKHHKPPFPQKNTVSKCC